MPRILSVLFLLGLPQPAQADEPTAPPAEETCPQAVAVTDLLATITAGETAFVQMDRDGIASSRDTAIGQINCLNEQIAMSDAARFHRLLALVAFVARDRDLVQSEFHVSNKLEPHYEFPEGIVPADHPVARLYEKAKVVELSGELQVVLAPIGGWATVDGVRTDTRLSSASAIIQIMNAHGVVVESSFVRPLDLLPKFDLTAYNMELVVPVPRGIFQGSPTPWLIATGTSLLISGGLYTVGMIEKERFENTENPISDDELSALRDTTNTLGVAWVASSALTATLGIITFTVVIPNHKGGR
ncbi:MAG: hypothetical protein AAB337_01110 [Patescibacteria group bacterium]